MAKVALINDTSTHNPHFGCQLVGQTFREQFARVGLELSVTLGLQFELHDVAGWLKQVDLVVINGEGSTHHGSNLHILELARHYPAVLVNCVWQGNPRIDALSAFRYIAARESFSAAEFINQGVHCNVVPDVMFASAFLNSFVSAPPEYDLGFTDNVTDPTAGFGPKPAMPADYLRTLSRYRRLCTGRFHAAIAATVLRIPFASWDSNTWKTRAMMQDMGVPELHFGSQQEAAGNVPQTFDPRLVAFHAAAIGRVHAMFETIADIAAVSAGETESQSLMAAP